MADLDIGQTTTTDLKGTMRDFSVQAQTPDRATPSQKETVWDYPNAAKHLGYYKTIPEIYSMLNALAIWAVGKGWIADNRTTNRLKNFIGWGEDSFQSICHNLIVQKKVFGDAYAEIVREGNTISGLAINIKPLYTGDMRVIVGPTGIIERYEQKVNNSGAEARKFRPEQILHLVNNRVANEIRS